MLWCNKKFLLGQPEMSEFIIKSNFFFQFKSEPVNLHEFKDFSSFPGKLPLPTEFEWNADIGSTVLSSQVSMKSAKAARVLRAGRSYAKATRGAPCGLPRTRARPAALRPLKVDGQEETARLRSRPGGEPFLPLWGVEAVPTPSPQQSGRWESDQKAAANAVWEGAVDGDPQRRAAGWGESPTRPKIPAGLQKPQRRGWGVVPLLRGDDTLARETRAPDPVTPPSPPNRPWRGRKVLESLRGRQALSAPYLGVLDLEVGRGRRQEVQGRHEGGGVGLHLAGHLDLTGSHEGGPRSRSPAAWFVRDVRSVREPGARLPVYRQVSSWGSSYWTWGPRRGGLVHPT